MKKSGVLLHISSLPNPYGIGSFGASAYQFVDLLVEMDFNLWQVLPLCPTDNENSPYNSHAPNDFNPLFIDLPILYQKGIISLEELNVIASNEKANPSAQHFESVGHLPLTGEEKSLGVDYSFAPKRLDFVEKVFARANLNPQDEAKEQWFILKQYANAKGIEIIGDIPYYVSRFSDEVKNHPQFFNLETQGGAPPDYFALAGQAWSVPTYNWQADGILDWWANRIENELKKYDYLRIDHFRGLVEYWQLPADAKNGLDGKWIDARPYEWLDNLQKKVDISRLIAEDLGAWSEGLEKFVKFCGIPNMKVFQFGFDGNPDNPHLPKNVNGNCVYYSGTHDNDTLVGFCDSVFKNYPKRQLAREYLQQIFNSKANTIMIQAQDLLFLGSERRMNIPGQLNAWTFRLLPDYIDRMNTTFFRNLNRQIKQEVFHG